MSPLAHQHGVQIEARDRRGIIQDQFTHQDRKLQDPPFRLQRVIDDEEMFIARFRQLQEAGMIPRFKGGL